MLDVPGARFFLRNAMAGMVSADVAVLVVAADPVEFAAGAAGTLLHAQLAHTAGLRQVVVAVTATVDIPSGVCALLLVIALLRCTVCCMPQLDQPRYMLRALHALGYVLGNCGVGVWMLSGFLL